MKAALKTGFMLYLVLSFVLGNVYLGAILICVHAEDGLGEQSVHFHYGQLPGQACNDVPKGLQHEDETADSRHFPLSFDMIRTTDSNTKPVLNLLPLSRSKPVEMTSSVTSGALNKRFIRNAVTSPPDTSLILTTILII